MYGFWKLTWFVTTNCPFSIRNTSATSEKPSAGTESTGNEAELPAAGNGEAGNTGGAPDGSIGVSGNVVTAVGNGMAAGTQGNP